LRDLVYVEGRNVVIDIRDAGGNLDRFPALAAELVSLNVDVVVVGGTPQALAAKQATNTIPIVFSTVGDPVGSGLVTSLARPGGNVTGLSNLAPEMFGKHLDLLRQVVPGITRIAVLRDLRAVSDRTEKGLFKVAEDAARSLGIRLQFVDVRDLDELEWAFSQMSRARAGAVTVVGSTMFFIERRHVVDLEYRLPAVYADREFVDVGGLMSYGANDADLLRRAATYVDRSSGVPSPVTCRWSNLPSSSW